MIDDTRLRHAVTKAVTKICVSLLTLVRHPLDTFGSLSS